MDAFRHLLERFSRGIVLRRQLPKEFLRLPIYVSPEAGLRYWKHDLGSVDPMLCRMARELVQRGAVVWDVGANVGLFTFSAAARAGVSGLVLALEPDLWLAHLLTRSAHSIQIHSLAAANVSVLPAAAARSIRVDELHISERSRATNHLTKSVGSSQTGGARYRQQTLTVTLDFLLDYFPAPSVLKIDVESAEIPVLQGASKLLASARPTIWCEVAPENALAVAALLRDAGYQIYAAALPPEQRTPLQRASWDTLAVPLPA